MSANTISRLKAIIAALLVGALSLGFFWLSAQAKDDSVFETVYGSFAGALLSIAVLGVIYDLALRRTLAGEILAAVRLRDKLAKSGLYDISHEELSWSDLVADGGDMALCPVEGAWFEVNWNKVLPHARERGVRICVYLDELGASTRSLAMARAWDAASTTDGVHKKARLVIYSYKAPLAFGFMQVGDRFVIILSAPAPLGLGGQDLNFVFRKGDDDRYAKWLASQVRLLPDLKKINERGPGTAKPTDPDPAGVAEAEGTA